MTINEFVKRSGMSMEYMQTLVNPRVVWFGAHRAPKINGEIDTVHNVWAAAAQWVNYCCLIRRPSDPYASFAIAYTSINKDRTDEERPSIVSIVDRLAYEAYLSDRFPTLEAWEMYVQYCEDQVLNHREFSDEEKRYRDEEFEQLRRELIEQGVDMRELAEKMQKLIFKPHDEYYRETILPTYRLELELAKESKRNLMRLFNEQEYEELVKLPRLRSKYYVWQLTDEEMSGTQLLYG